MNRLRFSGKDIIGPGLTQGVHQPSVPRSDPCLAADPAPPDPWPNRALQPFMRFAVDGSMPPDNSRLASRGLSRACFRETVGYDPRARGFWSLLCVLEILFGGEGGIRNRLSLYNPPLNPVCYGRTSFVVCVWFAIGLVKEFQYYFCSALSMPKLTFLTFSTADLSGCCWYSAYLSIIRGSECRRSLETMPLSTPLLSIWQAKLCRVAL